MLCIGINKIKAQHADPRDPILMYTSNAEPNSLVVATDSNSMQ